MALRISDIIAETSASFARPNIFKVEVETPGYTGNPTLNLNCYNAQIPGLSMASTDKDMGLRSVAYSKIYDDVILSFYCSEDLWELRVLQDWMNIINSPITNSLNFYNEYTSTIKIINLSGEGIRLDDGTVRNEKTMTTTLHEAYPKKIDPIQLDYGSSDIMRMTTSFTYRNFTQAWGDGENEEPDFYKTPEPVLPIEQTIPKNRFF